jgi:hypothetical protein
MMVLTMAPVAFAADDAENTVGDTGSGETTPAETLQAKIKVAAEKDGTVTLDKDYTEDITIQQGQNITLNLNGKKLTNKTGHTITVEQGATLTINGEGTVDNVTHAKSALVNYGEVVLDNGVTLERSSEKGTLSPYSNGGNSYYTILNDKGATMTINDATVKNNGGFSSAIRNGGDENCNDESHLTIKDGNFSGGLNAVKNDECGILTINGGTFSNTSQYVIMNWNKATITNGTFSVKDSADAVLFTAAYHANRAVGELIVNNGTFTGNGSQKMVENHYGSSYTGTASITGGTFSSDVSAYVAEGYVQNNGTVERLGETNAVAKIGNTYYKTLADAVAAAQSGATVKLLANINGQTVIPADKNIVLDLNGKTMTHTGTTLYNSGTLVVKDSSADKSGKIVSTGNVGIGVNHNSTTTIEYANIQAQEGAVITGYATGATITIEDGVFTALDNAVVAGNGNKTDKNTEGTPERVNANKITINGGTFNGMIKTSGYVACGIYAPWKDNIVVNGGTFNITGGAGIVARGGIVVVNNGEFNTTGNATGKVGDSRVVVPCSALVFDSAAKYPSLTNDSKIQINDGKFKSDVDTIKVVKDDADTNSRVVVGSGYFTTDPSDYVASGYVAGTSDVSGYSYKVVKKTETGNVEVKPAVAKPEVKVDKIPQADKEKVAAAAKTVSAPTLGAAAGDIVKDIDEAKATDLVNSATEVTGDKKLYVQSSLKVEPTAYDAANKTLALEITPQYRVVASTATTANEIKLDGDNKNAQVVQKYTDMTINTPTEVTMELPAGFAVADGDKLSIQHTKNGTVEYYTGTVTEQSGKHLLTFTTNGFSPFVISVPAASIGENVYPTLQAAVDSVKSGKTIKLEQNVAVNTKATVAKTIKFEVATNEKTFAKENIVAGANTTVKVTGDASPYTYEFTYTKPSSGSSSGSSSSGKTTYKVTTSAVNNGGVNASPSNAEKGATITITLSPDKGYKLDKLTVTDGSGKSVSTVKKSDTVYTFTMPASAVKVGVSYVKATETPSKTKFNDVSANDWFASAVDYVTGKGMMNGTADNTFSPKANTTRGMLMTVLARHAGEDTTGGSVWYEKGMNWAKANGVSDGTNPQVNITREQLAAMLYRYAQNKKYDVSGAKSLDGYTDAQSVSSYAVPALQWANAAGVVTGKSGSKLDPKGNATRAEVAAMLMRFCENVK